MLDKLGIPSHLDHLIEKREQDDRRASQAESDAEPADADSDAMHQDRRTAQRRKNRPQ